jgi:hypothetical protein
VRVASLPVASTTMAPRSLGNQREIQCFRLAYSQLFLRLCCHSLLTVSQ